MHATLALPSQTPKAELNADDVALCRVYGVMAREFYVDQTWNACLPQLQAGWLRMRRDATLEWLDVEALVRAFWDQPET